VAICSVHSAVPVWIHSLAYEFEAGTPRSPCLRFDPSSRHLILATERAIFAFAPMLLYMDCRLDQTREESIPESPWMTSVCEDRGQLLSHLKALPSRGATRLIPKKVATCDRWCFFDSRKKKVKNVRDCVHLKKTGTFACIAEADDGELGVFHFEQVKSLYRPRHLPQPEGVDSRPRRAFAFETGGAQCLLVLQGDESPTAVFYRVTESESPAPGYCFHHFYTLRIGPCRSVSQSSDGRYLLFVCDSGVDVLHLESASVEEVTYRAPLGELIDKTSESTRWRLATGSRWWQSSNRRVSDDGRRVLLGWNPEQRKSTAISPEIEGSEAIQLVQASEVVSELCSLSPDGRFTLYLDVLSVERGEVKVNVFDEQSERGRNPDLSHSFAGRRTTWSVTAVCDSRIGDLNRRQKEELLSCLTYGFSEDGSSLVVLTERTQADGSPVELEESLKLFVPHGTEGLAEEANVRTPFLERLVHTSPSALYR